MKSLHVEFTLQTLPISEKPVLVGIYAAAHTLKMVSSVIAVPRHPTFGNNLLASDLRSSRRYITDLETDPVSSRTVFGTFCIVLNAQQLVFCVI